MEQLQSGLIYSPSVYSTRPKVAPSPDRPSTPTSFECYITLEGGSSSAADTSPSSLQKAKTERLSPGEEYSRAIFRASFLQAENVWLRRNRKSRIILHEGTVIPTTELLALGAGEIHDALTRFHLAFAAADIFIRQSEGPATSDLMTTIGDLDLAFEICRKGLDKIRSSRESLEKGGRAFMNEINESDKSYERFFGVNYHKDKAQDAVMRT
ncbi:hypothetical protein BO78DRAFT_439156 [Aspergillus sclerotiicarbonarius CBS 121057]|uniref:Uncharacterized protein n=1 Tax=Aspergillus sclerotiicarbonarius (strain CBS 121057 / IBT 28362) TaxID=1448318 RepID=A0A319F1N1_ASPSB|nr:hypothetical protein BO78DRAFT_439156 [Aspergillus sclerotiicarbonarius CBS 121057]